MCCDILENWGHFKNCFSFVYSEDAYLFLDLDCVVSIFLIKFLCKSLLYWLDSQIFCVKSIFATLLDMLGIFLDVLFPNEFAKFSVFSLIAIATISVFM